MRGYTREAGVRNLEREIATVCRKVAREIAEGRTEPVHGRRRTTCASYLGRPRFFDEVAERTERPGVATGLAWTPTGGDVLFVEATMMPSSEEQLILTGMLGDVMRESAQAAALLRARSNARSGCGDRLRRPSRARRSTCTSRPARSRRTALGRRDDADGAGLAGDRAARCASTWR